jgi:DNA modification methylase
MTKEEWNEYFSSHWTFGGARQNEHLAVFPEELPHRLIKMFSFVGETVIDPFCGSGTTLVAAKKLGRNSIGYEINPEYAEICRNRLKDLDAFAVYQSDKSILNIEESLGELPYLFSDPLKMVNKIDVKKLQFGSRIDDKLSEREEYYTVKKIINPFLVELNNSLTVRLIGISEKPSGNGEATKFLTNKILGQKVYLKYDEIKFDNNNTLLCYLYLKNKTFINAHLIKAGLVRVDQESNYKQKTNFIELEKNYG